MLLPTARFFRETPAGRPENGVVRIGEKERPMQCMDWSLQLEPKIGLQQWVFTIWIWTQEAAAKSPN